MRRPGFRPAVAGRLQQCLTAVLAALAGGEEANRKGLVSVAGDPASKRSSASCKRASRAVIEQLGTVA